MENKIATYQNEEKYIRLLAAQRQLYKDAKNINLVFFMTAFFPIVLATISSFVQQYNVLDITIRSIAVLVTFAGFGLDRIIRTLKKDAAQIQLKFDVGVYSMSWNKKIFGNNNDIAPIVAKKSKSIMSSSKKEKLYNWYAKIDASLPINDAILLCQKASISWDNELRKRYKWACVLLGTLLVILVFSIGIVLDLNVRTLMWWLLYIAPIAVYCCKSANAVTFDIVRLNILKENVFDGTTKTLLDLQKIQAKITEHRSKAALIPDWFYFFFRAKDEDTMKSMAKISTE